MGFRSLMNRHFGWCFFHDLRPCTLINHFDECAYILSRNSFNLRNEWIHFSLSLSSLAGWRKKTHKSRVLINFFSRLSLIHKLWLFIKEKNSRSMIFHSLNICTQPASLLLDLSAFFLFAFRYLTAYLENKEERNVKIKMLCNEIFRRKLWSLWEKSWDKNN